MQLTTPTTVVHLGNAAREQRMSVDLESLADIIRPLTDLYSDRILAFVREYSTNAWDSHLQAGVTEPIQVALPTRTDLFWMVRDFGLGLSADELADLYSVYGKSRNRGSDVAAGMYGFGSKSALAYADDFSIISVKDGIRNVVQVVKDNDGIGVLKFLDQRVTTERNGVTVKVPVKVQDVMGVRSTSMDFYKYWDLGTVEVDGTAPDSVWEDTGTNGQALILDPDVFVHRARWGEVDHKIVMGQVAYPVPGKVLPVKGWSVVARVPMGAVFPTPSREALKVNDQTVLDTLTDLGEFVNERIVASVQERLEAAPSPWARFKVWYQATNDWEVKLPDEFNMRRERSMYDRDEPAGWTYSHGSRRSSAVLAPLHTLLRHGDEMVVHSFPLKALTPVAKARIANYCDSLGRRRQALVLRSRPEVLDGHPNAIAYADLPEVKRERGERVVSQGYKWKVYKADGTVEDYEAPSPRGGLVSWYDTTNMWPSNMIHLPGVHVATLRKNQVDKFKRTFPHARPWYEVWAEAGKAARAQVTSDDAIYDAVQSSYKFTRGFPNFQDVQDPDLRKVMEVTERYRKNIPASYTRAQTFGVKLGSFDLDGILNRYPLISRWTGADAEDAVLYINTKYNKAQEATQ
jgi:hypothetical protein